MTTKLLDLLVRIFLCGCILFGAITLASVLLSLGPVGILAGIGLGVWIYRNRDRWT